MTTRKQELEERLRNLLDARQAEQQSNNKSDLYIRDLTESIQGLEKRLKYYKD